eukprot:Filipodium_phascolosomae@DN3560_c0_g1_i1.p1
MSRDPCRIFVGGLPEDIRSRELEDLFKKYGHVRSIDVKFSSKGTAYAFIAFEEPRDADEAIRHRDGYRFSGHSLRVERSGEPRNNRRITSGPPRRSEFGVLVKGLPRSASWQDLKDHMRRAGPVGYAAIRRDGVGIVEFQSYDDMHFALNKLDGTTFKNPFDRCKIRLKEHRGDDSHSSRSRSTRKSRSRSRDKSRSTSRSVSSRHRTGRRKSYSSERKSKKDRKASHHKHEKRSESYKTSRSKSPRPSKSREDSNSKRSRHRSTSRSRSRRGSDDPRREHSPIDREESVIKSKSKERESSIPSVDPPAEQPEDTTTDNGGADAPPISSEHSSERSSHSKSPDRHSDKQTRGLSPDTDTKVVEAFSETEVTVTNDSSPVPNTRKSSASRSRSSHRGEDHETVSKEAFQQDLAEASERPVSASPKKDGEHIEVTDEKPIVEASEFTTSSGRTAETIKLSEDDGPNTRRKSVSSVEDDRDTSHSGRDRSHSDKASRGRSREKEEAGSGRTVSDEDPQIKKSKRDKRSSSRRRSSSRHRRSKRKNSKHEKERSISPTSKRKGSNSVGREEKRAPSSSKGSHSSKRRSRKSSHHRRQRSRS